MPLRPLAPTLTPQVTRRPEVLAPCGDRRAIRAALHAGADAVYFGLDDGFNARARATNLSVDTLHEVVAEVHAAGARAYVTLNTLLFESELAAMEALLADIGRSGVDAIIVQDPAVCLLAQAICPELELHASTQMTISSAEGARFSSGLGVTRVVVPRELSVTEIHRFAEQTDVELEVFIHGALCMSWSGQCLTSEAWGGRSANRGQCAQSCRMPYELVVDGETRPLGETRYLLSPRDLAGFRAVPALLQIGVHTLKIEGRLKGPAYVATTVGAMQRWLDTVERGEADQPALQDEMARAVADTMLAYSRGVSDGFLGGSDHQNLVDGRYPKHRGRALGVVTAVRGNRVDVARASEASWPGVGKMTSPLPALNAAEGANSGPALAPPEPVQGAGVVFDAGNPEDTKEPGGPLFFVRDTAEGWELGFGKPGPDLSRVAPGMRVWLTSDPRVRRLGEQAADAPVPSGRHPLALHVRGRSGEALTVEARWRDRSARAVSERALAPADGRGIDAALLRDKLGALGGTLFHLADLAVDLGDAPLHLPVSALKKLRRSVVAELTDAALAPTSREVREAPAADPLRATLRERLAPSRGAHTDAPELIPLCRTDEQLDAVIAAGLRKVELDWMEMVGLGRAFDRAKEAGLEVSVATVRVQKPGEEGFDRRIAKLKPDGVLVRHWGGVMHFADAAADGPAVHGDFSLNLTNSLSALHVLGLGLDTITAAHDLDAVQLRAMLSAVPAERVTLVLHHHIATFHTEHCVYAHTLSEGRDWRSCGRPCEAHRVALRDHREREHPVIVDVGCRNTVFNAAAQSAAGLASECASRGVRRFRVEFVWESGDEAARVLAAYGRLLRGECSAAEVVAEVGVHEQFGVTSGTMQVLHHTPRKQVRD